MAKKIYAQQLFFRQGNVVKNLFTRGFCERLNKAYGKLKNKRFMLCLFVFFQLLLLVGCSNADNKEDIERYGLFTKNIKVDGVLRRYAIYIPQGLGMSAVPLVFELHGGGVYIEDMTGQSGYKTPYKLWMELADSEKFIVVYPEGLNGVYGKPTWNDCRGDCIVNSNADDVHFIEILINDISANYNIDPNRVYVSGTSNGGFMAERLAIELNDKIAAIAVVAAAMPAVSKCGEPVKPVSVLFMNGTNDNHMPYNGGIIGNPPDPNRGTVLSTDETVEFWINFNRTDTVPEIYTYPDLDTTDGSTVQRFRYRNGVGGTEVVLYKINGGGHSAPSIKERYSDLYEQYFNKQNHDIEMTTEVWNFFKNHTLNR